MYLRNVPAPLQLSCKISLGPCSVCVCVCVPTCGELSHVAIMVVLVCGALEPPPACVQDSQAEAGLGEQELCNGADMGRAGVGVLVQLYDVQHLVQGGGGQDVLMNFNTSC